MMHPHCNYFLISLSISSEILSSVTFAYPCVVLIFVWPIIFEMLSMGTPAETIKVSKVWRLWWYDKLCLNWSENPNSCISNQIILRMGNGKMGLLSSVVLYKEIICSATGCNGINDSTLVFLRYVLIYFRPSAVVPIWCG